jgi:hypothetical protein
MSRHSTSKWGGREEGSPHFRSDSIVDIYHECPKVPSGAWSEAVMTATFLINRTSSRILNIKSPCELLLGNNMFVVPPKVFGCTSLFVITALSDKA